MPDSPVSATDPLREALEQIAALQARWQAPTSSEDTADSNAKWAAVGSEAHGIAVDALEAVPAEPEAWEWRAVEQDDCFPCGPFTDKARAQEWARRIDGYVERRRAPGPWERVDPEPLTFPPLDEGPLAHLLDGPVKPDPPVDPEPQRATGPWERVDLRARLCPMSGDDCPHEGPTHSDGSPFGPCDECDGRPQDGGER